MKNSLDLSSDFYTLLLKKIKLNNKVKREELTTVKCGVRDGWLVIVIRIVRELVVRTRMAARKRSRMAAMVSS